jgi:hypothetical protein
MCGLEVKALTTSNYRLNHGEISICSNHQAQILFDQQHVILKKDAIFGIRKAGVAGIDTV